MSFEIVAFAPVDEKDMCHSGCLPISQSAKCVVTCVSHIMLTDVWALSNEHVLQVVDLYWRPNWALYQICRITATSLDLSSYCYVIKKKRQGTYFHVWHAHFCSYSSIFSLAVDPRTPVPHLISGSPLVPQEATHCPREWQIHCPHQTNLMAALTVKYHQKMQTASEKSFVQQLINPVAPSGKKQKMLGRGYDKKPNGK